jgi:integrase
MPDPARLPKYRHYKPKNLGVVRIDGRDIYLGKYGTPESWERYHRALAEWHASGVIPTPKTTQDDPAKAEGPTVNELILSFWRHSKTYYRRADGTPTGELDNLRLALRPLKRLYGSTPARRFRPKSLKSVRQTMIDSGLCRRTINQRIGRILRAFRYGVENELVPARVLYRLKQVPGLKSGRSEARESKAVKPVADTYVDAVRPFLSRQLWTVIELQRLTGMRSGEALMMRTCDLDTAGRVWEYVPNRHKPEHHGKERRIFIGPRAQEILRPWLLPPTSFAM